jgi:LysM repeat protein
MNQKNNPQEVINKYAKRQRFMPYILGGLAGILALLGILIIIAVVTGSGNPFQAIFSTKTPTATATFTPTATVPTPTASMTPTVTQTPTETATSTPSGPMYYEVQQYDNCSDLAAKFNVDLLVLLAINNLGGECNIIPGQRILIPAPGQELPTPTPLPSDLPRGTVIEYTVRAGDSLASIASQFNSTVEDILLQNNIEDENYIYLGQILKIRVNLVTPTPTVAPTSTLAGQLINPPTSTPTVQP